MKKLAIQGHSTRGKEVIELLEMMGGKNCYNLSGLFTDYGYYFIGGPHNVEIRGVEYIFGNEDICLFTLEEFLEKYPFKVGDKVVYTKFGENCNDFPEIIESMKWTGTTIEYIFNDCVTCLAKDLKMWNKGVNKEIVMNEIKPIFKSGDVVKLKGCPDKNLFWIVIDVVKDGYIFNDGEKCSFDDQHHYEKTNREVINTQPSKMKNVLAELLDHIKTTPKEELEKEFKEIEEWSNVGPTVEEFMTFCESVNKKPKYPTTYEECEKILGLEDSIIEGCLGYEYKLLNAFQKLLMCRDAYWKIAGEEMGLDRYWKPDWKDETQVKYMITTFNNELEFFSSIHRYVVGRRNHTLSFPTEEMRDAFFENFKDLIEQCKELL